MMIVIFVSGDAKEEFEYPDEDIDYDYQCWNVNQGNGWNKVN